MNLSRRFPSVLLCSLILSLAAHSSLKAQDFPRPGKVVESPLLPENLDPASYMVWENGSESAPKGPDGSQGPSWILWTNGQKNPGHSGMNFGASKNPGQRHLRTGFKSEIPVGTVLTRGNIRVSVLKNSGSYPGKLDDENQWIAGQRIDNGEVSSAQGEADDVVMWIFPPGTSTKALRFSHNADPADPDYQGWIGSALILKERLNNLSSSAIATSESNNKNAGRLINGMSDSWEAWENIGDHDPKVSILPAVSKEHPEKVMVVWPGPVQLDGVMGIWTGFGAAEIQTYVGPKDKHPRDSSDKDWESIKTYTGYENGYPIPLWPNNFAFGKQITTRAIRMLITDITKIGHDHLKGRTADGKRVWFGELMAYQDLGSAPLKAPAKVEVKIEEPHPPIAVPFTLPEAGYVTLVIEDAKGMRIRNLVSETWFPAGKNTAWWDGTDDLGRDVDAAKHGLYNIPSQFVDPGTYSARGLWRKEVEPFYEFAVYSNGNPPWDTPDHTGAWLANHSPPSSALFVPGDYSPTGEPSVLLGCYVTEGPDGMAWVDLDGNKRGGMKWIGGNWTAAPYMGRDVSPKAETSITAYVGSVWENDKVKGEDELRITSLENKGDNRLNTKTVYKSPMKKPEIPKGSSLPDDTKDRFKALGGLTAYDGVIACAMRFEGRILFINAEDGKVAGETPVKDPRGVAYDAAGKLFVISGTQVVSFARPEKAGAELKSTTLVTSGLEDPVGLALDADGNMYVSDEGSSHQVKVFTPAGKLLRSIGHAGKPKAGPYDPQHMNYPSGLAIDSKKQLWVTEHDYLPKRVSVWSLDGKFIKAFYGPSKYGGGGMLDNHDKNKFYYADETNGTLEFKVDWKSGAADLVSVPYRSTPETLELPFRSAAPETALYHEGKRYFTNCYNSNPTGGHQGIFVFLETDGVARAAAGMGLANDWPILRTEPFRSLWPEGIDPTNKDARASFIWSDQNDDAQVQPAEVKLFAAPFYGITVMEDLSFCISKVDKQSMRFAPASFSKSGVPSYDFAQGKVLANDVQGPASSGGCQVLADESDETVITLGVAPFHSHSISGTKGGKATWSYPSPWPGLHASHEAAKPDRPGQIIGTTRLLGGFVQPKGSEVAPLWAVNGNMGNIYLFTRDGLFVATIFEDVRIGKLWKMAKGERGMSLKGITLHDENFWPSISQTSDGQVYLVDGSHSSLVRLSGLDTLRPITSIPVTVTADNLKTSQEYVVEREVLRQKAFGSGVLKALIKTDAPKVDGNLADWSGAVWVEIDKRGVGANFNSDSKPYNVLGAMAVSGTRLYAAWDSLEPKLLVNSGEMPNALFKTGGALDLMIGSNPSANPERREPVAGDVRLLVTRLGNKTKALIYRPVVPGAAAANKVPFSSPWRTISFDQVEDVSDQVELSDDGKGHFEISVPLSVLGVKAQSGTSIKGDIGILRGNGSETTARCYWSNKATGITADVPSEAMLTPYLWGTVRFE